MWTALCHGTCAFGNVAFIFDCVRPRFSWATEGGRCHRTLAQQMRRYLKGVAPISIPLLHLLCLGRSKLTMMGGLLNLLKDLRETEWNEGRDPIALPQTTALQFPGDNLREPNVSGWLGPQWFVGSVVQRLCAGPPTLLSIFSVCVCFPHVTRPKSGDPAGAVCEAHTLWTSFAPPRQRYSQITGPAPF